MKYRILRMVNNFFPDIGGVENRILRTSLILEKKHIINISATRDNNLYNNKYTVGKNIKVNRYKTYLKMGPFHITPVRLIKFLRIKKEYDLIHLQGIYRFHVFYTPIFKRKKIPIVLTTHGMALNIYDLSIHKRILRFLFDKVVLKMVLRQIDHIFVVSLVQKKFLQKMGIDSNKISISLPGVNDFFIMNNVGSAFRERYNIPKTDKVIGFVGGLTKNKNIQDLLNTYVQIKQEIPYIKLLLIGNLNTYVQKIINELKEDYRKDIVTTGLLTGKELTDAYYSMDVFVHPSLNEGFSTVLLESSFCGTPFVAYSIPSMVYLNKVVGNGVLAELRVSSLIEKTKKILTAPINRRKIRLNMLNHREYWSWDRVANQLDEIYLKLMEFYDNKKIFNNKVSSS
ncbi:hypothetical protein AN643_01665 [Candidatus Epulonipiscioides saccharophilum]|nr:hypothetical protein AN643_01665 [Epulopiscium sp. SCG-B10WGA-EpuloB]